MAHLKMKHYIDAVQDCTIAVKLDKKYTKAWLRRGTALVSMGSFEEAIPDFEHVLKLDPTNASAKKELARNYKIINHVGIFVCFFLVGQKRRKEKKGHLSRCKGARVLPCCRSERYTTVLHLLFYSDMQLFSVCVLYIYVYDWIAPRRINSIQH